MKMSPLSEKESLEYIEHRLRIVGSRSADFFPSQALSLIAKYSRGIPRVINNVCGNALLAGYSESLKRIEVRVIREIIGNLEGPGVKKKIRGRTSGDEPTLRSLAILAFRYGLIVLAGLTVGVFLYFNGTDFSNWMFPSKGPGEINKSAERREPPVELGPSPRAELTKNREGLAAPPDPDKRATPGESPERERGATLPGESISQTIKVTKGQALSKIALQYYGKSNESLVDLIITHNPSITDADLILVNQEIHLPELKEETLLASKPDKTIIVHLGTFSSYNQAILFKNNLPLSSARTAVRSKKVSRQVAWHRVEAVQYGTIKDALADIRILREKGLLPFF